MRWERLQHHHHQLPDGAGRSSSGPGRRWGHSCNAVQGGKLVYVFGGYGQENCQTNKVHVFDTAAQIWSEAVTKGCPPTARDSHTCTAIGNNLYVFGCTDGHRPLNDLYILDTTSNTWFTPNVRGEGPEPREGHSAAPIGKRLYIFGGCGKSSNSAEEIYYNDLYVLNTETLTWKCVATTGIPPSPRDSHTCSSWKDQIIVIGGEDEKDYYLSDVHIFDTEMSVWRVLDTVGDKLQPRGGHTTVAIGKNLIVFGGFTDEHDLYDDLHMLDIENGLWSKLFTEGEGPSARFSVAGDSLYPMRSGVLMFIGGCNRTLEALDDIYYLHTGLTMENARDGRRLEKLSLRKQLKLKCQEHQLSHPTHNQALLQAGTVTEPFRPMPVTLYSQPSQSNIPNNSQGIKSFQAQVTQSLTGGFAIETVIDGKLLRGIVFSTCGTKQNSNGDLSWSKQTGQVGGLTDQMRKEPNTVIPMELDGVRNREVDYLHGKEAKLGDTKPEGHGVPERASTPATPDLNLRDDDLGTTAAHH